jgi:hypothetical protein
VSDVDHRLARSAMQHPTSRTADTDANADRYEQSQHAFEQVAKYETELAEVRAELEAKKSELEVVRSRLMDAENGWAKSRAEAVTGSSQDQVTLWRNKYEARAKLYSQALVMSRLGSARLGSAYTGLSKNRQAKPS